MVASSSAAIHHPRCEACYFVRRGNIAYVYCRVNPRHKQRQGPKHKQGTVQRPTAGFTHWSTRGVVDVSGTAAHERAARVHGLLPREKAYAQPRTRRARSAAVPAPTVGTAQ